MKDVLVVDDSKVMREMVVACLRGLPEARFTQAASGLEAIERLSLGRFDLVVLDLNMPDISGIEVLEFVRAQDSLKSLVLQGSLGAAGNLIGKMVEGQDEQGDKMNGLVAVNSLMAMVGGTLVALLMGKNDPGFAGFQLFIGTACLCLHPGQVTIARFSSPAVGCCGPRRGAARGQAPGVRGAAGRTGRVASYAARAAQAACGRPAGQLRDGPAGDDPVPEVPGVGPTDRERPNGVDVQGDDAAHQRARDAVGRR